MRGARRRASFINAQAFEWAAARSPMVGGPRGAPPPACQPQSSQGRERRALWPFPCPALGAGGWHWTGLGTPLRSTRRGRWGSCPGRGPEGTEDSSQQQGPVPTGRSAPATFPTPSHTHPRLPQLGPGLRGSRQGWGVAPGAEATSPTSRGACAVSRGMFRQVGVSPAP